MQVTIPLIFLNKNIDINIERLNTWAGKDVTSAQNTLKAQNFLRFTKKPTFNQQFVINVVSKQRMTRH